MAERPENQVGFRNNIPSVSQTAKKILWWKSCTQAVSSIWKNVCQLQEEGPLPEGMQEQEGPHIS